MTPEEQQSDMSMEDILSSIKDILENESQEQPEDDEPTVVKNEEHVNEAVETPVSQVSDIDPEDDVFDLSKAMIVDDATENTQPTIELDETGPDFDINAQMDDEPLLSPDDIELPEFSEDTGLNMKPSEEKEEVAPVTALPEENVDPTSIEENDSFLSTDEDFSFDIDDVLKSASEVIASDQTMAGSVAKEENNIEPAEIDVEADPIFEMEADANEPILTSPEISNELTTDSVESALPDSEPEDIVPEIVEKTEIEPTSFEDFSTAVEEPQNISANAEIISEAENTSDNVEIAEAPKTADATDVSADIINNFAKMFAEKTQEQPMEPAIEPVAQPTVTELGNGSKTIEQVVENVIHGIIASAVSEELVKHVDIEAFATQEIKKQIKDWLEAHLPAIVDAAVQKEIERVMAKVGK